MEPLSVNWLRQSWPWWLSSGLLLAQFQSENRLLVWLIIALVLVVICFIMPRARLLIVAALLLVAGLSWGSYWGGRTLDQALPTQLIKQDIWVNGMVQDLPQVRDHALRFRFRITNTLVSGEDARFKGDVLLNWYDKPYPDIKIGQQWALKIRLKPAHGMVNPGGFNYEQWLFSQRIRATGYVRQSAQASLLAEAQAGHLFGLLRTDIKRYIEQMDLPMGGILKALTIGERSGISEPQWRVFRDTGTAHLIAISGLHIGLIAGMVYALVHFLWRYTFLTSTLFPAQHPARIAALVAAGIYAALAGFSVPTVRALLMLVAYFALAYLRRNPGTLFTLGFVLVCVLIVDPLAPLGAGLWLSFGAVAAIAYAVGAVKKDAQAEFPEGRIHQIARSIRQYLLLWTRIQWAVFIGLMPLMLIFFGQFSIISLLANFIAIPLFGMVIVPVVLLCALLVSLGFSSLASELFVLANHLLELIWPLMRTLSDLPFAAWQAPAPPFWAATLAITGAIILLTPSLGKRRFAAAFGFLPLFLSSAKTIEPGAFELQVLDVGQGLSVVVRTAGHTLLYDAGIKYSSGFDMGQVVVIPYFRQSGIKKLDSVVASHQNVDHYGGLAAVLEAYPARQRYSSAAFFARSQACERGTSWIWEEVEFSFLHPLAQNQDSDNNDSCVLSIQSRFGGALLTGDIELEAEQNLLRLESENLPAEVLLVPHHGSRTSSSERFIDRVNPGLAVISAGYLSRFGHPHAQVVQRYADRNIAVLNTASAGAINIVFDEQGIEAQPWRSLQKRYWMVRFKAAGRVLLKPGDSNTQPE